MQKRLGSGEYVYKRVEGWLKIPEYFTLEGTVGTPVDVAVNSRDQVYVSSSCHHPVVIFDRDSNLVSCWGEGHSRNIHSIFIGPDDSVFIVDRQAHVIEKYTPGGELLMTLGKWGWASAPPYVRSGEGTFGGKPFNMPSGVALGPSGDIFVSDGYGNRRVHKFSPEGELIKSWGEAGTGPGQFGLPHAVAVDRHGTVYVCDRANCRIQTFTSDGEFITMWTDFKFPEDLHIDQQKDIVYVVEGYPKPWPQPPKITIRDLKGNILSAWSGRESEGKGVMEFPHGIAVDSHGDIYEADCEHAQCILKFAKVG
jgi:DNA-binding beta-propeller fold protein YncE